MYVHEDVERRAFHSGILATLAAHMVTSSNNTQHQATTLDSVVPNVTVLLAYYRSYHDDGIYTRQAI